VKDFFQTKNTVKGKSRWPNEQGSDERGNADPEKALLKCEQEYHDKKWLLVGIYVLNKNINTRPMQNKAKRSAYDRMCNRCSERSDGFGSIKGSRCTNYFGGTQTASMRKRPNWGSMQWRQRTLMNMSNLRWRGTCKT
jgi:hypothetical protein